ncbi:hypothetical protein LG634_15560 [Streptomyces bambusae]|uniref:hypothetical protein n=1 Tax=Streptomyces bambusae TaxID=1550616 RepID=UPI001CFD4934|nr:hypothetical protein [Streptomyces bambusae]MCB5166246.1 hypothetical protein [Streptomyces bambusae]
MKKISLLTAAATGAAALGLAVPYAQAAPAPAPRELRLTAASHVALPVHDGSADPAQKSFSVSLRAKVKGDNSRVHYRVSFDLTALKGKVDAKVWYGGNSCRRTGDTAVCESDTGVYDAAKVAIVKLRPAKGAASGFTGAIKISGEVAGATVTPWTTKVQLGGPDLAMRPSGLPLHVDTKPGASFALPVAFSNKGTEPAEGLLVRLSATPGLDIAHGKYGNCLYGTYKDGSEAVLCEFSGSFAPGGSWQLAANPSVKASPESFSEEVGYSVNEDTPEERRASLGKATWTRGTGAALKLKPAAAAPTALSLDLNPYDNGKYHYVRVDNPRDYTAVGATLKGRPGETVAASFGFDFKGPGRTGTNDESQLVTRVTLPAGVSVVKRPADCEPVKNRTAGTVWYRCVKPPQSFKAGAQVRFPFKLKIDRIVAGAKGQAWFYHQLPTVDPDAPNAGPQVPAGDDPADNRAKITVVRR